jgi:hypothetical protein
MVEFHSEQGIAYYLLGGIFFFSIISSTVRLKRRIDGGIKS